MTLFDEPHGEPHGEAGLAEPTAPLARVRMTIAYDGSSFHGFAANPGVATVAGTLTEVLERVLRHPVEITCAGRTDKGVHAWGQVISFDAVADGFDPVGLQRAVNGLCAPAIVVRDAAVVPGDFDARFSARSRFYRYTVLHRDLPDPFLAATSWWVGRTLDVRAMQLAVDPLIGEHDFSSFCRRPKDNRLESDDASESEAEPAARRGRSLVRRVIDARWCETGDGLLYFDIEATAFCHQMVRSITGTLVDVGLGRLRAGDVSGILRARDRSVAGTVAPPHGLCLLDVRY